jgi:hypothetical protein
MTWFTYDADGNGWWLVMTAGQQKKDEAECGKWATG